MSLCNEQHPDAPVACVAPSGSNHDEHEGPGPDGWTTWPNESYIRVVTTDRRTTTQRLHGMARAVEARGQTETLAAAIAEASQRRNVGVPSSVQHTTAAERAAGARRATGAVEPEFFAAALEGGRDLCRHTRRITADDLWTWLDARGHRTAHPKAMRGILERLMKDEVMRKRRDDEEDHHRPPARSNQSRLLRVYESLIYEDDLTPAMRNFD